MDKRAGAENAASALRAALLVLPDQLIAVPAFVYAHHFLGSHIPNGFKMSNFAVRAVEIRRRRRSDRWLIGLKLGHWSAPRELDRSPGNSSSCEVDIRSAEIRTLPNLSCRTPRIKCAQYPKAGKRPPIVAACANRQEPNQGTKPFSLTWVPVLLPWVLKCREQPSRGPISQTCPRHEGKGRCGAAS
jgi:hypothetical protein